MVSFASEKTESGYNVDGVKRDPGSILPTHTHTKKENCDLKLLEASALDQGSGVRKWRTRESSALS